MPLVVYSLLRLALFAACWAGLWWAGLHPLVAGAAAALLAWAVSYVVLPGPRDAAAWWLADRAAERATHAGRPHLSPRAQQDAADEDAIVDAATSEPEGPVGSSGTTSGDGPQTASPSPSSTP